jgi:hypothetical protein
MKSGVWSESKRKRVPKKRKQWAELNKVEKLKGDMML